MDFGTFLREKEMRHPTGGGMDHFGAGGFHRFHGMEQGYRQRFPNTHRGYDDGGRYPGFAPRWNRPQGPYGQQKNMPMYNDYNNRRGAGHFQSFAPRSREYSGSGPSRQSQREVPRSLSGPAKKSGKDDDTHVEQDSQKEGPDAGSEQTQNSEGDNQAAADQSGTEDQPMHEEQDSQEKEMESYSGDSWKPIQDTDATDNKKTEDTEAEKEDEKMKAIKKLPSQHSRGLMSTLIELVGPEALNKKPDPLPPPQPMKLEDETEKYLRPSTNTPKLGISKSTFLESGITSKMLEEANMEMDYGITSKMLEEANTEIDYNDLNLLPEDIGRETGRNEFYCKLCKKQMTSLGNFRDHLNGKSHKSTLEAWKAGKKLPKGKKKATKPLSELGQKSVCLEVVEGEVEPILGLSFITEYHSITGVVCVCNLCAVKFDQNIVVSHTTGCKHRLRYMREQKPSVYIHLKKFGGKKSQLTAFLSDLCIGVEKEDGRGIPTIKIYNPEMIDDGDSLNPDEYENRRLINKAKRSTTVEEKDLESVDFQDWVNREMRRAKEKYDSKKRSPSPGAGDYGRSTDTFKFGTGRQILPHSDVGGRDYPMAPPMFPHPHQGEMYMPPPLPPPPFPVRQTPERYDAYVGHGSLPPMTEQYVNPVQYSSTPVFYHAVDPGLDPNRHLNESRSYLSSNNEVSEKKSAILFDYGHGSRDEERDRIRTSRRSSRSRDREISPSRRIAKRRADDRDDVSTSRKLVKSRTDKFSERDDITFKQSARRRMDERDDISTPRQKVRSRVDERDDDISTSRQKVRSRMDESDDISTSRHKARSRADERDEIGTSRQLDRSRADKGDERGNISTSRHLARSRADERDEVGTSRQLDRSRTDRGDERESIGTSRHLARSRADERDDISNSRQSAKSRVEERDEISTSRHKASSRADERNVSTSVSRADKWEDDIQNILGHSGKKKPLDSLALLSRTYSSPEEESPSPPRKVKHPKELPFSKTYLEVESQKDRRSSSELHSDLDGRRNIVKKERFVEEQPKSRSPDVTRVRRRSPENYVVDSPQASHLVRRQSQRVDSAELVHSQRGRSRSPRRSRSPVNVPRQQRRSRSPRDSSPVRSNKKPVSQAVPSSNIDTDAEAERIANLLLELSSSLSGQEDPQIALQTLFSNADLTRALLSSKSNTAGGKSSREKSSGEKMHSARSTEVGEPSGRHYVNVEQKSRYIESPDPPRRYAANYTRSPEQTHSFARPESSRVHGGTVKPSAHSSRDRLAFSLAGFNRGQVSLPKASLRDFDGDSDES